MTTEVIAPPKQRSADRIVECLNAAGVKWVFGVPGAKVDPLYDALLDNGPEIIVCRHEQNAAFLAAGVGRLTGQPGVAIVTSGPGTSNLATGLLTATTEGDPVVALCGAVPRNDRLKHTHQSFDAEALLKTVSKSAGEVTDPDNVPESVVNALRDAKIMPRGAVSLVLPSDVLAADSKVTMPKAFSVPKLGPAAPDAVAQAVEAIKNAKFPVVLAGMRAACEAGSDAIRTLIEKSGLPVVETFQAAGIVSRELEEHYLGRVGIFRNQPGDIVLNNADVVLAVGYDPVEYDAKFWNVSDDKTIINLDEVLAAVDNSYRPSIELRGDITSTVLALADALDGFEMPTTALSVLDEQRTRLSSPSYVKETEPGKPLDPIAVTLALRDAVDDETTVISDVGSHYIYMARYFRVYQPRHLLFSNGQQTLGVALPWAMAAALVRKDKPVLSVSGDGGFLFSAMELETAVRLGLNFVHVIFNDGTYDMVAFQQMMKYGRESAVQLGSYDVVDYARSFGASGHRVTTLDEVIPAIRAAMAEPGPSIIDIPVDYTKNLDRLASTLQEDMLS